MAGLPRSTDDPRVTRERVIGFLVCLSSWGSFYKGKPMTTSTFKRFVYAWWIATAIIISFGFWAKPHAQTYGSPTVTLSAYKYLNITGQATTVVKSSSGVLHTICVNTPAATETITIYDNIVGSGTKIGTITVYASINPCLTYDVNFTTGLTLVTATASSDLTVSYY